QPGGAAIRDGGHGSSNDDRPAADTARKAPWTDGRGRHRPRFHDRRRRVRGDGPGRAGRRRGHAARPRDRSSRRLLQCGLVGTTCRALPVFGRERLGHFFGYLAGFGFVVGKLASLSAMALTFGFYVAPSVARPLGIA